MSMVRHALGQIFYPNIVSMLDDLSEEQGERFHQDIRTMKERYQGYWYVNVRNWSQEQMRSRSDSRIKPESGKEVSLHA
ncbi:hypothetical protein EVAR_3291_1 [Eumeta japonica]|uniref:Uncharacterized protein n=1 Tax=Eumeta variegata TaxID=151549 RepID=A0A4C1SV65_EUMVA|nr:hypothetical protein EVAR_3291_1 [Eumeta japonica]